MEWVVVGAVAGIVTVSAFVGTTVANWWSSDNDTNKLQDSKIDNLQNQVNGVNVNVRNDSVNNYGGTSIALLIVLCTMQIILLIAIVAFLIRKCCCKKPAARRNSFEMAVRNTD